jgi:ech hydrogenase subunit B
VTGASTLPDIFASPVAVAARLPGALLMLVVIAALKLRKSPFDISASHHAHQELVRGLTSDMSGRQLALVEVAHWYETAILFGLLVPMLFNWSLPLGLAVSALAYGLVVLVDNSTSRARWQLLLRFTWATTLVITGGNLFALYLKGW